MARKPTYEELEQRITVLEEESARGRRAEEATKRERQRLYEGLEAIPVYVVLLAPDYHVAFANRVFRKRFGESHGKCCFEYLFNRTEACETCETYTVTKTHAPHHWEWTGPDGRNYDISAFPFIDTDGSSLILEMGIDITELEQAEEALREAHNSLKVLVGERTAELAQSNAKLRTEIEDRGKVEEALRQSHEHAAWLARFPEENPSPVVRVSVDGGVLYRNPAAVEIPGWACAIGEPMDYRLGPLVSRAMAEGKEEDRDVEIGRRLYSVWVTPFPSEGYANV